MEHLQLKQFFDYHFLSNIQCSSIPGRLAFVVAKANETNGYDNHLFLYDENGLRQLTSYSESNYIWDSEDTLLFTSTRNETVKKAIQEGEEHTVFYRIAVNGGEAIQAFTVPLNVSKFVQIEKGRYLMQVRYDLRFSHMYCLEGAAKADILREKREEQDYQVVSETPYRLDGAGWTNGLRNRLFLYDEASADIRPLIQDETFTIDSFELSADKRTVVLLGDHFTYIRAARPGIYVLDLESGHLENLVPEDTIRVDMVSFYQNGLLVAATNAELHGANEKPDFYTLDLTTKELRFLSANEYTLHSGIRSDSVLGTFRTSQVKEGVYYTGIIRGYEGPLVKLNLDGSMEDVVSIPGNVDDFDVQGDKVYYIAMEGSNLQELYKKDMTTGITKRLTSLNQDVLKNCYIAKPQKLDFENDGIHLDGWVMLPKDYKPGNRYPAILDIHGGPCMTYGEIFYHEMQCWANEGYFVFFCNPRGSDGRGEEFADIRGKLGTIDYSDIMKFTDTVLESYPDIDPNRVGVTGGSYGGYMTNWIIGHTNRFACAVSQRSISNWIAQNTYSDIAFPRGIDSVQGKPWGDVQKVWDQSPLQFAHRCTTPTLFIHSAEDFRCPLPEGIAMYTAIANCGVPARMCIFKGESHGLSLKGKPRHRLRRLQEITRWMNHYLKEEK